MSLEKKFTRFRAYQLGNEGASYSYFDGSHFTLVEARLTETSELSLKAELKACGQATINCLHITSWDTDHCNVTELKKILENYGPRKIEYPGYLPHTDSGNESLKIIKLHKSEQRKIIKIDPEYIDSLESSKSFGYRNVLYHPKYISEKPNDNSTVKLFRTGCFNVASLGDVEDTNIASRIRGCKTFKNETDIIILAHHGADNGFTTNSFLKVVKPTVAVCCSNYDNQYEHPKQEIRDLLHKNEIRIFTTKTGDVLIESTGDHTSKYQVTNLISGSSKVSSTYKFKSKKSYFLAHNEDAIKNRYRIKSTFYK
jgi:competence protein ComEC